MTDSKSRCVVEISTDTRPIVYLTIDRPSTDYRPTIDQPSTDYRPTIDRLSTKYRPTVDRLSADCRPLYRPLCRPISRSTLPTVNKIRHNPTMKQTNLVRAGCKSALQPGTMTGRRQVAFSRPTHFSTLGISFRANSRTGYKKSAHI